MMIPRILITADRSGSGKTTVTCGLLRVLLRRGLKVCSFKCGPDFIDPMFHRTVLGIPSSNLDTFLAPEETVLDLFGKRCGGMDVAVLEGAMGFYDGIGTTDRASSYHVSHVTKTPAVLVFEPKGQSLTAAAMIKGLQDFRGDSDIRGVILSKTGEKMYKLLKPAIEEACGIPVLGHLPKNEEFMFSDRHLGLVTPGEIEDIQERIERIADVLEENVDIDGLLEIAQGAPELAAPLVCEPRGEHHVKVAVAKDSAFCFIYEDNIDLLRKMGAEVEFFSPMADPCVPEGADGIILCGGYPELYGKQLAENASMLADIAEKIAAGVPCMAECGGFIYLHETFEDIDSGECKGAGVIKGRAYRTSGLQRFGYVELLRGDARIPAHEFHHYDSTSNGDAYMAVKTSGSASWRCIHETETMMAGFPHLYYPGCPEVAEAFLTKCERRKK